MAKKAPGKHYRKGVSLLELYEMFPNDEIAEQWFVGVRWPDGLRCPHCGGMRPSRKGNHPTMPYHCPDCRKFFSAKTGTVMQSSKIGYRKWALAVYIMTTGVKGTSSMKLHRDIGVTQKTAWHMAHRIRETWASKNEPLAGTVEVDETYVGGRQRNRHKSKRIPGRGTAGKAVVVGAKDRDSSRVIAEVIPNTDMATLQGFIGKHVAHKSWVFTDEHASYYGLPNVHHARIKHSVGEYVAGQIHTNGIESFWALLKRGYVGTYHHLSFKHLSRYVNEFSGRHNDRPADTAVQMRHIVQGMTGKQLRYEDLIREGAG